MTSTNPNPDPVPDHDPDPVPDPDPDPDPVPVPVPVPDPHADRQPWPVQCTKAGVKIDGVTIPKGSMVVVCTNAIHRDARYFPEPELFKPARFLGTKVSAMVPPWCWLWL